MIIQPKIRGFICTTAHPKGCEQSVKDQIEYVKSKGDIKGPLNVLVIGSSTGYGLAARIVASFGAHAKTIGVAFEKAADDKRTATAGWYNTAAFENFADEVDIYAKTIIGDAFSDEVKHKVTELIKKDLGKVDLIIYSLASPRRTLPGTGQTVSSVLKPIGKGFKSKTVDAFKGEIKEVTLEPATPEDINNTVLVMGGDDWEMWIDLLSKENLLAENAKTVAFSYIGPKLTHAIYKEGTIGKAKEHLKKTAERLNEKYSHLQAVVSVNKALVTQSSSAIPVVPLYISLLFKIMKEEGTHEECVHQMYRLFNDYLYGKEGYDDEGYIRLDDLEMQKHVQQKIEELWPKVTADNLLSLTDLEGYRDDFYKLFGFHFPEIDYAKDVDPDVLIPSLNEEKGI